MTAEDGHVVEGMFGFTVDVPQAESLTTAPSDSTADSTAGSPDGTAARADAAEELPAETPESDTIQSGPPASVTTLRAGDGTRSAATTTPSSSATSGDAAPAESSAASEGNPPRLAPSSSGAAGADRIAEALRIVGLLATLAIVGGLAFASFIVRDEPSERARVHRALFISGIALVAAAVAAALVPSGGDRRRLECGRVGGCDQRRTRCALRHRRGLARARRPHGACPSLPGCCR